MAEREQAAIAEYIRQTLRLRSSLERIIRQLWDRLPGYRDGDLEEWLATVLPIVQAAHEEMGTLTSGYLQQLLEELLGRDLPDLPVPDLDNLRGVDAERVYARPIEKVRWRLALGDPLDKAAEYGRRIAENIAVTDLQLAQTHTTRTALSVAEQHAGIGRIVGYRRVLTGRANCAMCILASTQRYHVRNLMPIHPGCDCAVAPIVGDQDPGQVINSVMLTEGAEAIGETKSGVKIYSQDALVDLGELLEPVHEAMERTFGTYDRGGREIDYRQHVLVYEHGELGPVLAVRGHRHPGQEIREDQEIDPEVEPPSPGGVT